MPIKIYAYLLNLIAVVVGLRIRLYGLQPSIEVPFRTVAHLAINSCVNG